MIIRLSDLLRTALDSASADLISVQGELNFVREYLDLEKMRFDRRLQIEWLVAPATIVGLRNMRLA
jgi:two-component system LytT family sensor kinase